MKFRCKNLLIEPYRLFFGFGALYSILAVGVWFAWLHALDRSISLFHWLEGPQLVHAHAMIYGVVGFYVFGFSMTAFPRFVNQPLPSGKIVLTLATMLLFAQGFLVMGTVYRTVWMIPAAVLESSSYLGLLIILGRLYVRSGNFFENKQPLYILLAIFFGMIGVMLSHLYYALRLSLDYYSLSIELGTYAYLFFLVVSITYRIVPFFIGRVMPDYIPRRGKLTLEIVLILILMRMALILFFQTSPVQNFASWGLNLLLLFVLVNEWRKWLPPKISSAPMLLVLFLGLAWILIFLGFSGYEILAHLLRPQDPVFPIFRTPALHALYIGCFGTLLLGISTRVVRGHGGLPIVADKWMLAALIFIQLSAILRVTLPVLERSWPIFAGRNYWAGLLWCAAFILWAIRYIPYLGLPKIEESNPSNASAIRPA